MRRSFDGTALRWRIQFCWAACREAIAQGRHVYTGLKACLWALASNPMALRMMRTQHRGRWKQPYSQLLKRLQLHELLQCCEVASHSHYIVPYKVPEHRGGSRAHQQPLGRVPPRHRHIPLHVRLVTACLVR